MEPYKIWDTIDTKIIAILRGVKPSEVEATVIELISAGISVIEIPLNSPNALQSIEAAVVTAENYADAACLIGAGTVLEVDEVRRVKDAGGSLIVSPNVDADVIGQSLELEMFSAPGAYTPSECLKGIHAGAHCLKVFPANMMGPAGIKALGAVFGDKVELCAVGGIGHEDFKDYLDAGASAFGLGSLLYTPGMPPKEIGALAKQCVASFNAAIG